MRRKKTSQAVTSSSLKQERQAKAGDEEDNKDNEATNSDYDEDDELSDDDKVIPHQYQIQVRWNNATDSTAASVPISSSAPRPALRLGNGNVDKMSERVRDRLFEHREEEHWHEKAWLKKNDKTASSGEPHKPAGLVDPRLLDYGPHQRDTPIRDQLPHTPTKAQTRAHFAIPTRNFGQSVDFVEWAQRDVDLNEWPEEPSKKTQREQKRRQIESANVAA